MLAERIDSTLPAVWPALDTFEQAWLVRESWRRSTPNSVARSVLHPCTIHRACTAGQG